MKLPTWFHKLGSPPYFYRLAEILTPWFYVPAIALLLLGAYGGLVVAPADYQQGDGFRIIYVHVPSAYLSTMVYAVMATTATTPRARRSLSISTTIIPLC